MINSTESGITIDQIQDFLSTHEWYDNSRLETQLACKRKAYYQQIGPFGIPLSKRVGPGADFGTCMHAAHEVYYHKWKVLSETQRRLNSVRAFEQQHRELFPNGTTDRKHTLANGLDIWDDYCDYCLAEDTLYRPVDPEIGFIVRIAPRPNEPTFTPFWYVGRADGVWERLSERDYFIGELKTSSGGVDRRIKSLTFHRQPVGYVALARELVSQGKFEDLTDPLQIIGHFVSVIGVGVSKRDFDREFFPDSEEETESWRYETIQIVTEWRARMAGLRGSMEFSPRGAWKSLYYKETEECTKYGLCPYWDLCKYGVTSDTVAEFEPESWNPITTNRGSVNPIPEKFATDPEAESEVIRIGR